MEQLKLKPGCWQGGSPRGQICASLRTCMCAQDGVRRGAERKRICRKPALPQSVIEKGDFYALELLNLRDRIEALRTHREHHRMSVL